MFLLVYMGFVCFGFRLRFDLCTSGFVGLVGYGCRYCGLRCNILVAAQHDYVISHFVFKVMVRYACMRGMFNILGGLLGLM